MDEFNQALVKKIKQKISSATVSDHRCGRQNNLTVESIIAKLYAQKAKCYYCNHKMKLHEWDAYDRKQFTIERLNNSRGHWISQCVIACYGCNTLRHDQMSAKNFRKKNRSNMFCLVQDYQGRARVV